MKPSALVVLSPAASLAFAVVLLGAACGETPLPQRLKPGAAPSSRDAGGGAFEGSDAAGAHEGVLVLGDGGPHLLVREARPLPVPQATEPTIVRGFSVNAGVHSLGEPTTWRVEYGPTAAYGARTDERSLPPKLSAHLEEAWSLGRNGWAGGFDGTSLVHVREMTASYLRYTDRQSLEDDTNHLDGIGVVHLPLYGYVGNYWGGEAEQPTLLLGGGHPDLRGARFALRVRGVGWAAKETTLVTWFQTTLDTRGGNDAAMSNWAYTQAPFGAALASGAWELVTWQLRNRTTDWTYAGQHGVRNYYVYKELDRALADVNVDLFPAQLVGVNQFDPPSGAIDFDDLQITYRNHSVLAASNGGHLVGQDADPTTSRLTDGWRNGTDREWESAPEPTAPRKFLFRLDRPVALRSIVIHNSQRFPSKDVQARVSTDGTTFVDLGVRELPEPGAHGPNHLFTHFQSIDENGVELLLSSAAVRFVEVTVLSGRLSSRWALGEIEAFGEGALVTPENAWDDVNRDVVVPAGTYHYRVVASSAGGTTFGPDQVIDVPPARAPSVEALQPASGPPAGGSEVLFHGEGLAGTQTVTICGRAATILGVSRVRVLVETPAGSGTCAVSLVGPGTVLDLPAAFTYR